MTLYLSMRDLLSYNVYEKCYIIIMSMKNTIIEDLRGNSCQVLKI